MTLFLCTCRFHVMKPFCSLPCSILVICVWSDLCLASFFGLQSKGGAKKWLVMGIFVVLVGTIVCVGAVWLSGKDNSESPTRVGFRVAAEFGMRYAHFPPRRVVLHPRLSYGWNCMPCILWRLYLGKCGLLEHTHGALCCKLAVTQTSVHFMTLMAPRAEYRHHRAAYRRLRLSSLIPHRHRMLHAR